MKKKIMSLMILSVSISGSFGITFADEQIQQLQDQTNSMADPWTQTQQQMLDQQWSADDEKNATTWSKDWNDSWWPTTVTVTEKIPGMDCNPDGKGTGPEWKKYKCTIQPGFGSVMLILRGLIKYATFITALVGVLMLVVSWVQYSIAGADKSAADAAKKRIEKVLAGIVLLFLIGFILNSVAPWVYH